MRHFLILLKKELKELITPQIILPFIIVVLLFSILGNYMKNENKKQENKKQEITIINLDKGELGKKTINTLKNNFEINTSSEINRQNIKDKMKENNIAVAIILPEDFSILVESQKQVNIKTYANVNNFSFLVSQKYTSIDISISLINELISTNNIIKDTNNKNPNIYKQPILKDSYVIVGDKTANADLSKLMMFITQQTTIIPIILFMVIIIAAQMVSVAVATEKENKTLETLLSSPINRKTIVMAKMVAAGLIALIMAAVYIYGYKNYMDGISAGALNTTDSIKQIAQNLGLVFNTQGYILLGTSLFVSILVGLAIAMILGSFAQDAKAAQGVIAPLMVMVMIPYFLTILVDISSISTFSKTLIYLIPFSHAFLAAPNILLGNDTFVLYGIIYQAVVFLVFVIIAAKIFSSDYIMTMKLNFSKKTK